MAKGALAAGYAAQGAGGGARSRGAGMTGLAQIGLSIGAAAERKNIREQEAQKEFTEKREAFRKEQQELYDGIAYEDQFEDTGITDLDEAGQKFADTLRSEYEMNNQMYEMGYIDEAQLRKRNARMKGQVKHLKEGLYGKMTAFKENFDKLQAEGKESEADSLKMQMMEEMTKNISFGVDGNGNVELRTPGTGDVAIGPDGKVDPTKATRIPLSKFNDLMTNENGVQLNDLTDRITDLEGAGDIYQVGSREYTRYTGFAKEGGRKLTDQQSALMDTAIAGLSQTEKIDALSRLGGVFTDEEEYNKLTEEEKKDALFVDPKNVMGYGVEMEREINEKLKLGLNNKLMNELVAKESSKPFQDPIERAKAVSNATKEPLTYERVIMNRDKTAPVRSDGFNDTLQIGPNKGKSLTISSLAIGDKEADNIFKRSIFQGADGTELPGIDNLTSAQRIDAIKNAKFVNAEMPWNSKKKSRGNYKEATFTLEIQVPDYSSPTGAADPYAAPEQVPTKTVQIKYSPAGYAEYNNFMSLTGRDDLMVGTTREGAKEIAERNQRGAGFNND
tara:strand:- start:2106 stop:3785 length:1680 start_codon:yes stop_codon:yes gene_type:complete